MTTKTLKASSGRPLPMHVSQHGSTRGARCTLSLAPMSCLTPASVDTMSSCHGVFTLPHSHTPACSSQTPPRPQQSRQCPSAPLQACPGGNFSWCLFKVLFSRPLTAVLWHGPSFLHGGLVWSCFLAYGDFLGRGWVRRQAG